jgi:phosphohistidine phosphatase
MKTLYLLRHAKSSWNNLAINDFDRPLNDRGYSDAHLIGNYLSEKKIQVDFILSSPAIRAVSTAIILAPYLQYSRDNISLKESLYDSSLKDYLNCVAQMSEGNSILLAGHNNTISELAQDLSTPAAKELKTCGITAIQFRINSWSDILFSKGELMFEVHPSLIKTM